jgi:hypothetical protein
MSAPDQPIATNDRTSGKHSAMTKIQVKSPAVVVGLKLGKRLDRFFIAGMGAVRP